MIKSLKTATAAFIELSNGNNNTISPYNNNQDDKTTPNNGVQDLFDNNNGENYQSMAGYN
jgi:hypothetical protein